MLCRVPGGKSFLGCGTMTILPSSCLSFIWLPLWLTRTNPSFSSLLRTSLLFMSFLYATCATKSIKNTHVAHRTLLVTGYEKRRPRRAAFCSIISRQNLQELFPLPPEGGLSLSHVEQGQRVGREEGSSNLKTIFSCPLIRFFVLFTKRYIFP